MYILCSISERKKTKTNKKLTAIKKYTFSVMSMGFASLGCKHFTTLSISIDLARMISEMFYGNTPAIVSQVWHMHVFIKVKYLV